MANRVLEAALTGCAAYLGIVLAQELRDPYSTVRLRLAELHDRIREVRQQ